MMRGSGESCGFSTFRIEESLSWALFHASSQIEALAMEDLTSSDLTLVEDELAQVQVVLATT
jgi:hypothetical protein